MADSRFIKLTAFGGYDKADVDKRLESLYDLVYNLKNEVRETKLLLKKFEEGSDQEKAYENALAVERAQLTQLQVKNENLSEKNKAFKEELKAKDAENAALKEEIEVLKKTVSETELKLSAVSDPNGAGLGVVFVEAQKSRELILSTAKKEAEECENTSKRLAEEFIAETNNKAKKIIFEAEKQAADIIAEAKNSSEEMKVAEGNLKVVMLSDIEKISAEVNKLRSALEEFEEQSMGFVTKSETLLKETGNELKNGGVPVFKDPQKFAPEYPAEPSYEEVAKPELKKEEAPKKNDALDRLQAMAEAIGTKKNETVEPAQAAQKADAAEKKDSADNANKSQDPKKKSGINLNDLLKQANSIS